MDTPTKSYILVVDDERDILLLLRRILESAGFEVRTVEDGPACLDAAAEREPDVILLDVMMPGMNGIEVVKDLKSHVAWWRIQVILVSARAQVVDRIAGLDAGADDYITKPFDKDELLARVRAAVRIRAFQRALDRQNDQLKDLNNRLKRAIATMEFLAGKLAERTDEFTGILEDTLAEIAGGSGEPLKRPKVVAFLRVAEPVRALARETRWLSPREEDRPEPVNLGMCLAEQVGALRPEFQAAGMKVTTKVEAVPAIQGNKRQIEAALRTVLRHAGSLGKGPRSLICSLAADRAGLSLVCEAPGAAGKPGLSESLRRFDEPESPPFSEEPEPLDPLDHGLLGARFTALKHGGDLDVEYGPVAARYTLRLPANQ